jgi:hypothetical protein
MEALQVTIQNGQKNKTSIELEDWFNNWTRGMELNVNTTIQVGDVRFLEKVIN